MMGFVFLVVIALVFAVIWINLARRPAPRARVRPEGIKVQNQDVELAEEVSPTPIDRREAPPRQEEQGQRPEGHRKLRLHRQEPEPDKPTGSREGRRGDLRSGEDEPDFPVEQPEAQDALTDLPQGSMPRTRAINFRPDVELGEEMISFQPAPETDWSLLDDYDPLPGEYREDLITAIVRNPRSLYVYWERSGEAEQRLREMLGDEGFTATTLCLRIFDISHGGGFTIDLSPHDDHWFIHGLEPGHRYVISHERRTDDGRYYLLALSGPVSTPRESPVAPSRGMLYQRLERELANGVASSPWR